MPDIELFPQAGLRVMRSVMDLSLAGDLRQEWLDAYCGIAPYGSLVLSMNYQMSCFFGSENTERPVTKRALEALGMTDPTATIIANYQPAHAEQRFHPDNERVIGDVAVIHAFDDGGYDFAPDATTRAEAEAKHEGIEVNAGDIVISSHPHKFHRGVNYGDTPRITLVYAHIMPRENVSADF